MRLCAIDSGRFTPNSALLVFCMLSGFVVFSSPATNNKATLFVEKGTVVYGSGAIQVSQNVKQSTVAIQKVPQDNVVIYLANGTVCYVSEGFTTTQALKVIGTNQELPKQKGNEQLKETHLFK